MKLVLKLFILFFIPSILFAAQATKPAKPAILRSCGARLRESFSVLAEPRSVFLGDRWNGRFFDYQDTRFVNVANALIPDSYAMGAEKVTALSHILLAHSSPKEVTMFMDNFVRYFVYNPNGSDADRVSYNQRISEHIHNMLSGIVSGSGNLSESVSAVHEAISQAAYGLYSLTPEQFTAYKEIIGKIPEGYGYNVVQDLNIGDHAANFVNAYLSLSVQDRQLFIQHMTNNPVAYDGKTPMKDYVDSLLAKERERKLREGHLNGPAETMETLVGKLFLKVTDATNDEVKELMRDVSLLVKKNAIYIQENQGRRLRVLQMSSFLTISFGPESVSYRDLKALVYFAEKLSKRFTDPPLMTNVVIDFRLNSLLEMAKELDFSLEIFDSLFMSSFENEVHRWAFSENLPALLKEIAKFRFEKMKNTLSDQLDSHLIVVNEAIASDVESNPDLKRVFLEREARAFIEKNIYKFVAENTYLYYLDRASWKEAVDAAVVMDDGRSEVRVMESNAVEKAMK